MSKSIFVFISFYLFLPSPGSAQDQLISRGNTKYEEYSFSPAIDIYKRVIDKGFVSAELLQKLGNAYYFNSNYTEAAKVYDRLIREYDKEVGPEYLFRYSQSLKSLGDYENSDLMMARFTEVTSDDKRAANFKSDYKAEIKKNSGRYTIAPFEYNSVYAEFAPALYKQGLIFSSDRDTGNLAKYRHTWNSSDFLDLYKVNVDSLSQNKPVKIDNINSRLHESTSVLSSDDSTLYFTRNNFRDGKYVRDGSGMVRLKIFRARLVDGQWSELEDLPFNSDAYSVAHPALSGDGKTLYFVSDMPGTLGQSDIYKIQVLDDGTFGKPENLGPSINTEARETFPYITRKNILYFSSDGHPGLGGLDIFATSVQDENHKGPILNVGEPVNSKWDDFTFIFAEESRKGYFASNRQGGVGGDDIYSFLETKALIFECVQPVSGTVRDKISNEILVGATIKIINEANEEVRSAITDEKGHYEVACDCGQGNFVRALMEGYVPSEEYLEKSDGKPRIMDFYLERETVTAGFGDDLAKLLQLSTIYFNYNKFDIRPDAEIEIQKVIAAMDKFPSLNIKANSHTDSRGSDQYNLYLSQKRAESTVAYMVSKGINAARLQQEGFGETRLVNQCENGVKCSNEEHELNRRSEFLIIE